MQLANDRLASLLPEWHLLLKAWSADGRLAAAAQEAMLLNGEPKALTDLTTQWAAGVFSALPPIVLLSSADINGALGAYALSTGTIYLNADWLAGASKDQVFSVLTEELGHHLDGLLNAVDTPGDEGEYFEALLRGTALTDTQKSALKVVNDAGAIKLYGIILETENATQLPGDAAGAKQIVFNPWSAGGIYITPLLGNGAIWLDSSINVLYTVEADAFIQGYHLVGRNVDVGTLLSSISISDLRFMHITKLDNGDWIIGGIIWGTESILLERRAADGTLLWQTSGVGGRYEGRRDILFSADGNYCFVAKGFDGLAKVDLSTGAIISTIESIPLSGSGYHFFQAESGKLIVDTSDKLMIYDENLQQIQEVVHPFPYGSRITSVLPDTQNGGFYAIGYKDAGQYNQPPGSDTQTLFAFISKYDTNGALVFTQELDSAGINLYVVEAKYLKDGSIGIIANTGGGNVWFSSVNQQGYQISTTFFKGIDASSGFFVDINGDIKVYSVAGINGAGAYDLTRTISILRSGINAPEDIVASSVNFDENITANSPIANLSTTDVDLGNSFTYALVDGSGSTDNEAFTISGNQLIINASPNFELKSYYSIRLRSTDQGGLFTEKEFFLGVNNLNDVLINIGVNQIAFNHWPDTGICITPLLGNGSQWLDAANNTLYTIEADVWGGNGPHGYHLVGRNVDVGTLLSSISISDLRFMHITKLDNGDWIIGGIIWGTESILLERRAADGTLLWQTSGVGGRYEGRRDILFSADGNYCFVAKGFDGLAKVDLSTGAIISTIESIPLSGSGYHFFQAASGRLIVDTSVKFMLYDENLQLIQEVVHPFPYGCRITSVLPDTQNGGFYAIGYNNISWQYNFQPEPGLQMDYAFLSKFDAFGELLYTHELDSAGRNLNVIDSKFLQDGTIGIIANTGDGSAWFSNVDLLGNQIGTSFFKGIDASAGFFVDNNGDIRVYSVDGVNGSGVGAYIISKYTSNSYIFSPETVYTDLSSNLYTASITGNSLDNTIIGNALGNTLAGLNGNDTVYGGLGSDVIVGGTGLGDDYYDGGDDIDSVKYTSATLDIVVDLTGGFASGIEIGYDTLSNIENVIGGQRNDLIIGSTASNMLDGFTGDDTIHGVGGNDTLIGGDGNDTAVFSNASTNYTFGWDGNTILISDATGTSRLSTIENLQFSDRTGAINTYQQLNRGKATFSIAGASAANAPAVGNTLIANSTTPDPDGNGTFAYSWQTSTNGTSWSPVGTNSPSYTVTATDEGKQIRLQVTYIDGQGFSETVHTPVGTVPNIAPTVSSFSPADGSTGIAVASSIVLTFTEAIQRGTGAIELRSGSATGALIESFNAATSDRLSIVGSTLTIDPTNNLASSTQVFLIVPSGSVRDLVGNAYAGSTTYDFTTAAPADPIPPTITGITVQGTQAILQFSEAINTAGLLASRFSATVGGAARSITGFSTVTGDPTKLSLTISGTAATSSQAVTVSYTDPAGEQSTGVVQDLAGNDMATTTTPINATTFSSTATVTTLATSYLNLILSGTAAINGTGNANANTITGNSAVNQITGGAGNDTMDGGASGDIYIIATSADHTAAEIQDTGTTGTDQLRFSSTTAGQTLTVFAGDTGLEQVTIGTGTTATATTSGTTALSINASLAPNGLTLTGNNGANTLTGTAFADTLIGNGSNDTLTGNAGNDILNGGAGNDTMNGGVGSDIYLITTNAEHTVAEIADNGITGTDELRFSSTTAGQILTVFAGDTGLERVVIGTGTAATATTSATTALSINAAAAVNALTITGNDGANTLTGSALADTIIGNGGNDTLNGGLGNDTVTGGAEADIFRFASALNGTTNVDRITDFTPTAVATTADRIQLENTGAGLFTAITATGTLAATAFTTAAFINTTQRIRYESTSGNLFYDSDGNGAATAILFATLSPNLTTLNNTHFVVT